MNYHRCIPAQVEVFDLWERRIMFDICCRAPNIWYISFWSDGSYILWQTNEAFGEVWGLLVGYLGTHPRDTLKVFLLLLAFTSHQLMSLHFFCNLIGWVAGISHISSLPILFLSFVQHQFFPQDSSPENFWLLYGILTGISVLLTLVNYRGLDVVANATVVIFFLTMVPFVLLVAIGIPKGECIYVWSDSWFYMKWTQNGRVFFAVDPTKWLQTPSGGVVAIEGSLLDRNGWFPLPNVAGIACEYFKAYYSDIVPR